MRGCYKCPMSCLVIFRNLSCHNYRLWESLLGCYLTANLPCRRKPRHGNVWLIIINVGMFKWWKSESGDAICPSLLPACLLECIYQSIVMLVRMASLLPSSVPYVFVNWLRKGGMNSVMGIAPAWCVWYCTISAFLSGGISGRSLQLYWLLLEGG